MLCSRCGAGLHSNDLCEKCGTVNIAQRILQDADGTVSQSKIPLNISLSSVELSDNGDDTGRLDYTFDAQQIPENSWSWMLANLWVFDQTKSVIDSLAFENRFADESEHCWTDYAGTYIDNASLIREVSESQMLPYFCSAIAGIFEKEQTKKIKLPKRKGGRVSVEPTVLGSLGKIVAADITFQSLDNDIEPSYQCNIMFQSLRDSLTAFEIQVVDAESEEQLENESVHLWGGQLFPIRFHYGRYTDTKNIFIRVLERKCTHIGYNAGNAPVSSSENENSFETNSQFERSEKIVEGDLTVVRIATIRPDFNSKKHGQVLDFDMSTADSIFDWDLREPGYDLEQYIIKIGKTEDRILVHITSSALGDTIYETFTLDDGDINRLEAVRHFIVTCLGGGPTNDEDLEEILQDDRFRALSTDLDLLDDIAWIACYHGTPQFNNRDEQLSSNWQGKIDEDGQLGIDPKSAVGGAIFLTAVSALETGLYQDADDEFEPYETAGEWCDVRDDSECFVAILQP